MGRLRGRAGQIGCLPRQSGQLRRGCNPHCTFLQILTGIDFCTASRRWSQVEGGFKQVQCGTDGFPRRRYANSNESGGLRTQVWPCSRSREGPRLYGGIASPVLGFPKWGRPWGLRFLT